MAAVHNITQQTIIQEINEQFQESIYTLGSLIELAMENLPSHNSDCTKSDALLKAATHYWAKTHEAYERLNDLADCDAEAA